MSDLSTLSANVTTIDGKFKTNKSPDKDWVPAAADIFFELVVVEFFESNLARFLTIHTYASTYGYLL